MPSTNSAATISMPRTLPVMRSRVTLRRARPADPHGADRQRRRDRARRDRHGRPGAMRPRIGAPDRAGRIRRSCSAPRRRAASRATTTLRERVVHRERRARERPVGRDTRRRRARRTGAAVATASVTSTASARAVSASRSSAGCTCTPSAMIDGTSRASSSAARPGPGARWCSGPMPLKRCVTMRRARRRPRRARPS